MAYAAFADAPVDVAVVEVGMGGVWDATNVITPQVSIITPISLDHTQWLGDTYADIAAEKAGIIKEGRPVIVSAQPPSAHDVIVHRAHEVGAQVIADGVDMGVASRLPAVGGNLCRCEHLQRRTLTCFSRYLGRTRRTTRLRHWLPRRWLWLVGERFMVTLWRRVSRR